MKETTQDKGLSTWEARIIQYGKYVGIVIVIYLLFRITVQIDDVIKLLGN